MKVSKVGQIRLPNAVSWTEHKRGQTANPRSCCFTLRLFHAGSRPPLVCYSRITGEPNVEFVVFVRKRLVEVQYLRATIAQEQRDGFDAMVAGTIRRRSKPPKLNRRRALLVLSKIDEILAWEQRKETQRDTRFVELGKYLCEVRAGQYWRLENLSSFDDFLARRFPESRREAYYLMSIRERLPRPIRQDLKQLGWSKVIEIISLALGPGRMVGNTTLSRNRLRGGLSASRIRRTPVSPSRLLARHNFRFARHALAQMTATIVLVPGTMAPQLKYPCVEI